MVLMRRSQDEVQGPGGIPDEGPVFHRQVTNATDSRVPVSFPCRVL